MSPTITSTPPEIQSRLGAILRATSGHFLEQFDFFLFGFYASAIAKAFFPAQNETAALLNTFGVFWLGALMRPVGAIVLGAYIDRIGRRKGLIVTLGIMAVGTVIIAICPTYASIGVAAPILVLLGRLVQGFSAGVELGGVSVYLSEIATPGNRGFYTSFQSSSQQVAIFVASLLGYILSENLPAATVASCGRRALRPHRTQARAARDRHAVAPDRLPGPALAGRRPVFRQAARGRDDVLVLFRRLQRRHARRTGRDRAGACAHHLLLACLR